MFAIQKIFVSSDILVGTLILALIIYSINIFETVLYCRNINFKRQVNFVSLTQKQLIYFHRLLIDLDARVFGRSIYSHRFYFIPTV